MPVWRIGLGHICIMQCCILLLLLLAWERVMLLKVLPGGMLGRLLGGLLGGVRGLLSLLIDDSCQLWNPDRSRRTGRACRLGWSPMLRCCVILRRRAAGLTQDAS